MKTIVCYGDSNTWGFMPKSAPPLWAENRYPADVRWTGILQHTLGKSFRIEEDGLNGRTTYVDDPQDETRNSLKYLPVCMQSRTPADLVIVMLGTNDVKGFFGLTPLMIARGMGRIVNHILNGAYGLHGNAPEVLIVAPPALHENILNCWPGEEFGAEAYGKAAALGKQYEKIAHECNVHFLDASCITASSTDGVHLSIEGHTTLGHMIAEKVREIFP